MSYVCECLKCSEEFTVPDMKRGRTLVCPHCGATEHDKAPDGMRAIDVLYEVGENAMKTCDEDVALKTGGCEDGN